MKSNAVKNLQENEVSKIIINNWSDATDEEVIGRVLKTMNEHKKYKSWVQNGELKKRFVGYYYSTHDDLKIAIHPVMLKTGTIKFDVC